MATLTETRRDELREFRRELRRRAVRRRRLTAAAVVGLLIALGLGLGRVLGPLGAGAVDLRPAKVALPPSSFRSRLPDEIRGVHVTMSLLTLPGKLSQYLALKRDGLNTLEIDVKDELGQLAPNFYDERAVARRVHEAGLYLIGRVVGFEDPVAAEAHPAWAIHRAGGGLWRTSGGLAWLNPYSRAAWRYDVDVAAAAARAGFDEIQFDYVRFPSDGDLSLVRYPGPHPQPFDSTVAAFLRYAVGRLHPLGVRVSADVFGLSATRDLGIGQFPGQVARVVDAVYPMTYPSHYVPGEYGIADPNASPGKTVAASLRDFRVQLAGTETRLVPWLQDFSLGRTYTAADVDAQIRAARHYLVGGFMLWNPVGLYTTSALKPGAPPDLPDLARPGL